MPKKAKKIVKKKASKATFTVRPHPITGTGVKVHNKTGQMWQIHPVTGKRFWGDLWNGAKKVFNWANVRKHRRKLRD